jgi:hydroxymethylpyrimidine pyrophosphatase-like HAD family hydrolase
VSYRLLVTDLDGTLLMGHGAVAEADRAAIAALLAGGVHVSILTGRMYSGTHEIARSLGLRGPIACVDGSHIVDLPTGQELLGCHLAPESADWLRCLLEASRPATFVLAAHRILHDGAGAGYLPYLRLWTPLMEQVGDVLAPPAWTDAGPLLAVVALGERAQIRELHAAVGAATPGGLQSKAFGLGAAGLDHLWGMVIRAAGTDKGTALEFVARHYGIDPRQVVAVGDWDNDIPMLRAAGRSFAMAQAPSEVKAAATDQLQASRSTGGGIAEAARRSGLW